MLQKRILIAAGMAACVCAPVAASAADLMPCKKFRLHCSGFEPNWSFVLPGDGTIRFTDPQNPNWQTAPLVVAACAGRLSRQRISITAVAPLSLSATVRPQQCTEPSGQPRPLSIHISYTQGAQTGAPMQVSGNGCCW